MQRKKGILISILIVVFGLIIGVSLYINNGFNFFMTKSLSLASKNISKVQIASGNNISTIDDKESIENLLIVLESISFKDIMPNDQLPSGRSYKITLSDEKGLCQDPLDIVGDSVGYKGKWYKIDEELVLSIRDYYLDNK